MKFYVVSAGIKGISLVMHLRSKGVDVFSVIDNDVYKQGNEIEGVPIRPVSCLAGFERGADHVLIPSDYEEELFAEISRELIDIGLNIGCDFSKFEHMVKSGLESRIAGSFLPNDLDLPPEYVPAVFFDPVIRVNKTDEKRIFRYIAPEYKEEYLAVLKRLTENSLLDSYVVNTKQSDAISISHPDSLFLEHEYISPISFPNEWPSKMLRAYALWMLDFVDALDEAGLCLTDVGAFNASYCKGRFIFYDAGAIGFGKNNFNKLLEIIEILVNPIVLMSHG